MLESDTSRQEATNCWMNLVTRVSEHGDWAEDGDWVGGVSSWLLWPAERQNKRHQLAQKLTLITKSYTNVPANNTLGVFTVVVEMWKHFVTFQRLNDSSIMC